MRSKEMPSKDFVRLVRNCALGRSLQYSATVAIPTNGPAYWLPRPSAQLRTRRGMTASHVSQRINAKTIFQTLLRPRAHRAVGRWPPVSRAGRRVEKNVFSRSAGVKPPWRLKVKESCPVPGSLFDQVAGNTYLFQWKGCKSCRGFHVRPADAIYAFRPVSRLAILPRANHPPQSSRMARRRRHGGRCTVFLDVPHENL